MNPQTPLRAHMKLAQLLALVLLGDLLWGSLCVLLFMEAGASLLALLLYDVRRQAPRAVGRAIELCLGCCSLHRLTLCVVACAACPVRHGGDQRVLHPRQDGAARAGLVPQRAVGTARQAGGVHRAAGGCVQSGVDAGALRPHLVAARHQHDAHRWHHPDEHQGHRGQAQTVRPASRASPSHIACLTTSACVAPSYCSKVAMYRTYLRVAREMSDRFPVATAEECDAAGGTCAICLQDLEEARRLPCNHVFHFQCLRQWLQRVEANDTCPMCRQPTTAAPPATAAAPAAAAAAAAAPDGAREGDGDGGGVGDGTGGAAAGAAADGAPAATGLAPGTVGAVPVVGAPVARNDPVAAAVTAAVRAAARPGATPAASTASLVPNASVDFGHETLFTLNAAGWGGWLPRVSMQVARGGGQRGGGGGGLFDFLRSPLSEERLEEMVRVAQWLATACACRVHVQWAVLTMCVCVCVAVYVWLCVYGCVCAWFVRLVTDAASVGRVPAFVPQRSAA